MSEIVSTSLNNWEPRESLLGLISKSFSDPEIIVMEFRLFHLESNTISNDWDTLFVRFFQRYKSRISARTTITSSWYPSGVVLEQFITKGVNVNSDEFKTTVLKFRMFYSDSKNTSTNWDVFFLMQYDGFNDEI
jgi:hypothetical protein